MKATGALLLIGACFLFGFGWTGTMRRKIGVLDRLCEGLRQMESELLQRRAPLTDILERQGMGDIAGELRKGSLFSQAAEPQLKHLERLLGPGDAVSALWELTRNLGRYDAETQASACRQACLRLENCRGKLERELFEKQRLYHTVPVATGCMVVLVIL
ncbi:MAG: stage III sporulation protein AB [Clostridia bacterium]|nr:stage III sporulation protein AB [Clostridia bacterium]